MLFMQEINNGPIGVFDSGIGGLSIAEKIRELLPTENLLYIADSLHAPYGDKTEEYIYQRARAMVVFLLEQKAKAIVIACNTATVTAVRRLREEFDVPIIGVEPGVKPALLQTSSGVVGVLATTQTLSSASFNQLASHLASQFNTQVSIELQACPGLMDQVEALQLEEIETRQLVERYLQPLLKKGADNIVLGCTHYAFLLPMIREMAGDGVVIINTALAVAKETLRRLEAAGLLTNNLSQGWDAFWSSGDTDVTEKQISQLWGGVVKVQKLPV